MNVALFGSGYIARAHARAILDHPVAGLVAAANWRPESLARIAEEYSIPRVTTRWEELAEDPSINAVVIATPNALHATQTNACLRAGKHVLVEKPMATNVQDCEAMIATAEETNRVLMVGHCWRFRDEVLQLKERIESGELGEIVKTRSYGLHERWGPSGWFTDPQFAGGGALIDMGVHAIDTTRFLLGDPQPQRVCASVLRRYGTEAVDDEGILLINWSNGAHSVVESGWWQQHIEGLEAETEVYGTKGFARVFGSTQRPPDYRHDSQPMYTAQMAAFIDAAANNMGPTSSGEDGLTVMRVVEEAYRSSASLDETGRLPR
jgi:predicted dehydrogenase